MQEREVILTWEAIYDVADISDYIEVNFGRGRADRFEEDIRQEFTTIGFLGGVFGNTHIYYRSYSIFKKTISPIHNFLCDKGCRKRGSYSAGTTGRKKLEQDSERDKKIYIPRVGISYNAQLQKTE